MNINYRPEIDGLRGIAVLAVIIFHADLGFLKGGFLGVDIFFVISGYLITSIILKQIETKSFSLLYFYERRVRRILPALFIVTILCIPFAYYFFLPENLILFNKNILSSFTFWSNIYLWLESSDYFSLSSDFNPLMHTWSLSIEEQFYILFPICTIFFFRFFKKYFIWFLLLVFILSFLSSQFTDNFNFSTPYLNQSWSWYAPNITAFYLTPMRIWEIIIGIFSALILKKNVIYFKNLSQFFSILGFVLIFYSFIFYTNPSVYSGIFILIPTLGTFLIIIYGQDNTLIKRILSYKILISMGLISYSAYLFHQPVFAFSKYLFFNNNNILFKLILIIITLILASLSWKFIETPFRNPKLLSSKFIWVATLISFITIFFIYFIIDNTANYSYKLYKAEKIFSNLEYDNSKLLSIRQQYIEKNKKNKFTSNDKIKKILILGNSHAVDTYLILKQNKKLSENYEFNFLNIKLRDFSKKISKKSSLLNKNKLQKNNLFESADIILLSTRYADIEYLQIDIDSIIGLNKISKLNKKIFIISGNAPVFFSGGSDPVSFILSNKNFNEKNKINLFLYSLLEKNSFIINDIIKKFALDSNILFLDKFNYTCNNKNNECFGITDTNQKVYFDGEHYTLAGSNFLNKKLDLQFLNILFNSVYKE